MPINDLIDLHARRKRANFQIIPRALPGAAPALLAKLPEAMGLDLVRLFKLYTRFFYSRSLTFRTNVLDLVRATFMAPIIETFHGELRRYSIAIPSVVFVMSDVFAVLTSVTLAPDKTDVSFDSMDLMGLQFFIESVLMGHWGETTIFASRIVILVRFRSLVYTERMADGMINCVSLETGLFAIKPGEPCPLFDAALKNLDDRLPPIDHLRRLRSDKEVIATWRAGSLSASDFVLRLNLLRGRSFVDLDRYPVFPAFDQLDGFDVSSNTEFLTKSEVIDWLTPIQPFTFFSRLRTTPRQAGDLPTRGLLPADFYFHSIDDASECTDPIVRRQALETEPSFLRWVSHIFLLQLPGDAKPARTDVSRDPASFISRQLPIKLRQNASLLFNGDEVLSVRGIQRPLGALMDIDVTHDAALVAIAIQNYKKGDILHLRADQLLAFVSNISVGEFGLYFVADLTIGITIAFRVEYKPAMVSFGQISRFETDGTPFTVLSDRAAIAATFSGKTLVMWHIWSGVLHRTLKFAGRITAIEMDAAFNGLILATIHQLVYVTINGEVLCETEFQGNDRVTALKFVSFPMTDAVRVVFCGTSAGEVWVVIPDFRAKSFEMMKLASPHRSEIRDLLIHATKGVMLSADIGGAVCSWTWPR
jgi:hypothetical protein